MERLTKKNDIGGYYYPECFKRKCEGNCQLCDFETKVCSKLGQYESEEESGKLIHLPSIGQKMHEVQYSEEKKKFITREVKVQALSIRIMIHTDWIGGILNRTIFFSRRKAIRQAGKYNKEKRK